MSFNVHKKIPIVILLACALVLGLVVRPSAIPRTAVDPDDQTGRIQHVLLISIDGMHALDYDNCSSAGTCPRNWLAGPPCTFAAILA
jgi:predicted AlkP superfamily pyrophosphatase or phosphodiesterase